MVLENILFNCPFTNKNCLWPPCLLTYRDEMRNLYRGPAIDPSYQVLFHLAKRFRGEDFLEIDQPDTRIPMVAMFVNVSAQNNKF